MTSPIAIKRINGDYKAFIKAAPESFDIYPNPENILEIYFLMYGLKGTNYEGGQYIGMIKHNPDYPRKAPDYYMLTPNGRFDINKKICLTNSGYHQADWAPAAWNLVSILEGFSSVFHSEFKEYKVGISHLMNVSESEIKLKTSQSIEYNKTHHNEIYSKFVRVQKIDNIIV